MCSQPAPAAPGAAAPGGGAAAAALGALRWDNLARRALPVSAAAGPSRGACFSEAAPTPLEAPRVVALAREPLGMLGLGDADVDAMWRDGDATARLLGGCAPIPGAAPMAHCYCGHQFGHFSGQLGDGATMYLGETLSAVGGGCGEGVSSSAAAGDGGLHRWEVQFKGAGPTLYSRRGDGRKVLRSSIREFLCSEAMAALGVPTTRAASLVTSDTRVERDRRYDGNITSERASVITRVAPTFLRFGSFETFKSRDSITGMEGPSVGLEGELLPRMLDYTAENFFPDVWRVHDGRGSPACYAAMLEEVARRTGRLVAAWQCVGFCHGVLNTDNMSIVGVTIDYGPFGFVDRFDPTYVCNSSDSSGRYDYRSQPVVCEFNVRKLAEAWAPAMGELGGKRGVEAAGLAFRAAYDGEYLRLMRRKMGLLRARGDAQADAADRGLVEALLDAMTMTGADWTNSWRALAQIDAPAAGASTEPSRADVELMLANTCSAATIAEASKPGIPEDKLHYLLAVEQQNPGILQARLGVKPGFLVGELRKHEEYAALKRVTDEQKRAADTVTWTSWLTKYRSRLRDDANAAAADGENCSAGAESFARARRELMLRSNPRLVPRQYVMEECIAQAEKGEYDAVRRLLEKLQRPFDEPTDASGDGAAPAAGACAGGACGRPLSLDALPPAWAATIAVS